MAYFCLILYAVAIYVRPAEIWFNFPFVELLAAVSAIVVGITYLSKPKKFWDLPHDKFVLGLWVAIVLSNLTWGWFGGAWWGFVEFLKVAFYYFLIRFAVREQWQFEGFVRTVIVLNVLLAVSGIVQFHKAIGLGGAPLLHDGRIRATGIFNDPNDLAYSLVMVVPFLFDPVMGAARSVVRRGLALMALAALALAIIYTGSRSGLLGLVVVVAGYSVRQLGRFRAAGLIVVLFVFMLLWGPARVSLPHSGEKESVNMRIHAWAAGLMMVKSDPFFGVGFGRFEEFHDLAAHNSFVHTLAELGILGGFFWVGLCYWCVKGILIRPGPAADVGPAIESWRPTLLLSFTGVLVCSWFLSRQYAIYSYTLFGLGAAYVAVAREQGARIELKTSLRDVGYISALIVAGMGVIFVLVRLLQRPSF